MNLSFSKLTKAEKDDSIFCKLTKAEKTWKFNFLQVLKSSTENIDLIFCKLKKAQKTGIQFFANSKTDIEFLQAYKS